MRAPEHQFNMPPDVAELWAAFFYVLDDESEPKDEEAQA